MSYAQAADFLARFDARSTGDLVNDVGIRQTPTQLLSDPNLQAALDDASGRINLAAMIGQRYTPAELAALTGVDLAILLRLVCDLAFVFLCQRRGLTPPGYKEVYTRADEMLVRLKNGELIFNFPSDVDAGIPACEFPSSATYRTVNLLRDRAGKLFPHRPYQAPGSGGQAGSPSVT